MLKLPQDWADVLEPHLNQDDWHQLSQKVEKAYINQIVYPVKADLFKALKLTPYDKTQVVILGQDPYHGDYQANGLAFSVNRGINLPPSLRNIYKELATDLAIQPASHGDLTSWAQQGVLLLNTVLTVETGLANSHKEFGWQKLTDTIIYTLNQRQDPVIFVFWGKQAQAKAPLIDTETHRIIQAPHPSPLSAYRGFFGSRPFSQINRQLAKWGRPTINWQVPE